MATRRRRTTKRPSEPKPTAAQTRKYGARGEREFTVNRYPKSAITKGRAKARGVKAAVTGSKAATGPVGATALEGLSLVPSTKGGAGKALFFLIVSGFVLFIILTGRAKGVTKALSGKGAVHTHVGKHQGKKVKP